MRAAAIGCRAVPVPPRAFHVAIPAPGQCGAPLLVVTDVGVRLVRRGLLAPADGATARWLGARALVFRHGPVVCELPPASRGAAPMIAVTLHAGPSGRAR